MTVGRLDSWIWSTSSLKVRTDTGRIQMLRHKHSKAIVSTAKTGHAETTLVRYATSRTPIPFKIVDNQESATQAIRRLQEAPFILIDGEGHYRQVFDTPSSGLSILQLSTPSASDVYLFDMLALTEAGKRKHFVLRRLDNLLSSKKVLKVGWGGREDLGLLKQAYGISVEPYLDMQLADIHHRIQRREGYGEQVKRLSSASFPEKAVRNLQLEGVHALSKMDNALEEHAIDAPLKESECLFNSVIL